MIAAASPQTPERIGPYRIERRLGGGAMGEIYLARDPGSAVPVALKSMRLGAPGDDAAEWRERFQREAQAAARLRHPGIVAVLDSGESTGLAWLAMEYVAGADLSGAVLSRDRLALVIVLDIGAQVADALGYAHRQGVVHRDVKPANVIFDPVAGVAKLTDFGIARIADASRTRTGVILGTPAYMAPEQIAGLAVDGRADLYALGALLFQLLCARLPHEASTLGGLLTQIARQAAPDVRSLRPELPEALARIVAQALAKRPDERPASGDAMAQALREVALSVNSSRTEPRHNSGD